MIAATDNETQQNCLWDVSNAEYQRFMAKVQKTKSCWLWTAFSNVNKLRPDFKYGMFRFRKKMWLAHRVAYVLFTGEISDGMHVLHKCDNTLCVNPAHLFLGTQLDNVRDCKAKGRRRYACGENNWTKHNGKQISAYLKRYYAANPGVHAGSNNGRAVLTPEQVLEIRRRYAAGGVFQFELADEFKTSQAHISAIVRKKLWKSL